MAANMPIASNSPGAVRERPARYIAIIGVFCILVAVTYKNDVQLFAESRWMKDFYQHPALIAFKSASPAFLAVPLLFIIYGALRGLRFDIRFGPIISLLALLLLFEIVRYGFGDANRISRLLVGGSLVAYILVCSGFSAASKGDRGRGTAFIDGLAMFSVMHIAINMVVLISGSGMHQARFLGTSIHPNFIGVQMATCALVLWARPSTKPLVRLASSGLAACAIVLVILSGSRTGLVVVTISLLSYYSLRRVRWWTLLILLSASILSAIIIPLASIDLALDQYDRRGISTRDDTIALLISNINANPFFGSGEVPALNENSYLSGWSAFGIVFPVVFLIVIMTSFVSATRIVIRGRAPITTSLFAGLLFGLFAGAALEGFLIDSFTYSLVVFFIACIGFEDQVREINLRKVRAVRANV